MGSTRPHVLYQKIYFKKGLTKNGRLLYSSTLMFVTSFTFYHIKGLKRMGWGVCVCGGEGGKGWTEDVYRSS